MTASFRERRPGSQPTLSRFFNRMDEDTLCQLNQIIRELRKVIYSIKKPEFMLFDIDSTLLDTYGNQEGEGFNYITRHMVPPAAVLRWADWRLLKAQLRDAPCIAAKRRMFLWSPFWMNFSVIPWLPLYLRGDSGFASPDLYEVLEDKNCRYCHPAQGECKAP